MIARAALFVAVALALAVPAAQAFPVIGNHAVLPAGTELGEDALQLPRELFKTDAAGGSRSYLVNLGDLAFSSPSLLGGAAAQAGISCDTCHVNGTTNPRLFIPGLSTHPGNFDTTGALFNPKADDAVLDPFTTPSLRGARYLAPYGHDGRSTSLRDFVRNVIVNEFAGPEPSPAILDAMVVYIDDIDFLPNPGLAAGGRLAAGASEAERRGEALFAKPFPRDPQLSCAGCHNPTAAFVDHRQHDVGSGGLFKTPTLLDANFNAPYFHDGRYDSYEKVVAHFDRVFDLALSPTDRQDLVAYLTAVGDGEKPYVSDGVAPRLDEIAHFSSVLDTAIPAHDRAVIALAVDTVGGDLREFTEMFPDRKDGTVSGGKAERARARAALEELVLTLRAIDNAATAGQFDEAGAQYDAYRRQTAVLAPVLTAAVPWSLFDPAVHDAHYGALRQMKQAATKPTP